MFDFRASAGALALKSDEREPNQQMYGFCEVSQLSLVIYIEVVDKLESSSRCFQCLSYLKIKMFLGLDFYNIYLAESPDSIPKIKMILR